MDLRLEVDGNHKLSTSLFDKRDDFNFPIVNFTFIGSNIPASPAYGVFVSQLIRYARANSRYQDFIHRGCQLTNKTFGTGVFVTILHSRNSMNVIMTLLTDMRGPCHAWLQICLQCCMVDIIDIVTGATCGAGNAHLLEHLISLPNGGS